MPASDWATDAVDVVVLAGGRGTRLGQLTAALPKPLVPVGGRPFVDWLLMALVAQGVRRVVVSTGHLGQAIEDHLGDGARFGLQLAYSREPRPLGTGGALRHALPLVRSPRLLVVNGDSLCALDLARLHQAHLQQAVAVAVKASLLLVAVPDGRAFGSVELDQHNLVRSFREKTGRPGPALVNAGVYLFERALLADIAPGREVSLEKNVLPELTGRHLLGVTIDGPLIDIGTPQGLLLAERDLPGLMKTGAAPPAPPGHLAPDRERQRGQIQRHLEQSAEILRLTAQSAGPAMVEAARMMVASIRQGGKLLICGNGGSASDSQHMAAELLSRISRHRSRPALPALALTADSAVLTAIANDVGYDQVFARQVEGLGRPPDLLLTISTSGRSPNVARAAEVARAAGLKVIALVGARQQGQEDRPRPLVDLADLVIEVPSPHTPHIQEAHLAIEHLLCALIEDQLFGEDGGQTPGPP